MGSWTRLRLWLLKRKAKRLYLAWHAVVDEYDCGVLLVQELSPRENQLRREFNIVWGKIMALDPKAPNYQM